VYDTRSQAPRPWVQGPGVQGPRVQGPESKALGSKALGPSPRGHQGQVRALEPQEMTLVRQLGSCVAL